MEGWSFSTTGNLTKSCKIEGEFRVNKQGGPSGSCFVFCIFDLSPRYLIGYTSIVCPRGTPHMLGCWGTTNKHVKYLTVTTSV